MTDSVEPFILNQLIEFQFKGLFLGIQWFNWLRRRCQAISCEIRVRCGRQENEADREIQETTMGEISITVLMPLLWYPAVQSHWGARRDWC